MTQSLNLKSRRGAAELMTTILAIPLMTIMIGLLLYFGRALYAKAALEDAAAAGARFAVTSLSGEKGCRQAREALLLTLQGYHLNVADAQFTIAPTAAWGRAARVRVVASYTVNQQIVPIFGLFMGNTTLRTMYEVRVDAFNNRYSNGWRPCVIGSFGN